MRKNLDNIPNLVNVGKIKGNYTPMPNHILYDKNLSDSSKIALMWFINYKNNPKRPEYNWNKKEIMSELGFTERKTDTIVNELERCGYLYREKCIGNNNRIQWMTYIYINPKDNPHYKGEDMNTDELNKAIIDAINKEPVKDNIIKEDTDNDLNKIFRKVTGIWNQNYFMTLDTTKKIKVDTTKDTSKFILNRLNDCDGIANASFDDIYELSWDIISYTKYNVNEEAYDTYRYGEIGQKIAYNNIKKIKQLCERSNIFKKGKSNINIINEDDDYGKEFILSCSIIIANYCRLGFFGDKLPSDIELLNIFRLLFRYPQLIQLKNNEEEYKLLDELYKKNSK